MNFWLFRRFLLRRWLTSPVRVILIVVSLALATSLAISVVSVGIASVRSLHSSLGLSQSGTLQVESSAEPFSPLFLKECIAPLAENYSVLGYQKIRVGVQNKEGGVKSAATLVGVTFSSLSKNISEETTLGNTQILFSNDLVKEQRSKAGDLVAVSSETDTFLAEVGRDQNADSKQYLLTSKTIFASNAVVSALTPQGKAGVTTLAIAPLLPTQENNQEALRANITTCYHSLKSESAPQNTPLIFSTDESLFAQGSNVLATYRMNIGVLAAITLFVCVLLISQAGQIGFKSIERELSILRTLGVGKTWVTGALLFEAILMGICGTVVGVVFGSQLSNSFSRALFSTAKDIYQVELIAESLGSTQAILLVFVTVVVVGTSILGNLYAVFQAWHISLSQSSKRLTTHYNEFSVKTAILIAAPILLVVGLSGALLYSTFIAGGVFSVSNTVAYTFVAAGILSSAALVPLLAKTVFKVGGLLTPCIQSNPARAAFHLGNRGVSGMSGSTLLSVMALSVAITVMISISVMVDSFRETLISWTEGRLRGDLFITLSSATQKDPSTRLSANQLTKVSNTQGVQSVRTYRQTREVVNGADALLGASQISEQITLRAYDFILKQSSEAEFDPKSQIIISEGASRKLNLSLASQVKIQEKVFSVYGVMREFSSELPLFLIDDSTFQELYRGQGIDSFSIILTDGVDRGEVRDRLAALFPVSANIQTFADLNSYVIDMFDRTFLITESVKWLVFIIAGLGFISAFLQQLWLKKVDFKVQQILGVSRTQHIGEIVTELLHLFFTAIPCGVVAGYLVGVGLVQFVNPAAFGWTLRLVVTSGAFITPLLFSGLIVLVTVGVFSIVQGIVLAKIKVADE